MALFKPATPASTEVNRRTTDTPVGPVALLLISCEFRRRYRNRRSKRRSIWFNIKSSTTKFWRLSPWHLHRLQPAGNQVNFLLSAPTTRARGRPRSHFHRRRGTVHSERRVRFVRSPNWKKHKLCLSTNYHMKGRQAYSLLTTMEAPATWTLGLVFQQAIDRQDRTLQSRRTLQLYWNQWRYTLHRTLPLPDKDSSLADDMPCRTTHH